MDSMKALKQPGIMAKLWNSKGFSLIEMAIVLVIIGVIIGAIIKGQDLIANSQAKKVISAVSTWRNLTVTFLDRNGRFPGDQNKNGIIGDQVLAAGPPAVIEETGAAASAISELTTTGVMTTVPANPVIVGSTSFWVYIGNTSAGTVPVARNAILVCGNAGCSSVFTSDQMEIIKAMDTSFDGSSDAGTGVFRAVTAAPTLVPVGAALTGTWMAATFSAAGVVSAVNTTAGTANTAWDTTAGTGHKAAVWLFDKPY
jgi:prepilin-type N-terminal cleavage/methylation domain-containing protein